ncbi:agamous-like MADS-box protein AGL12 isoform X2 [Spinacia oleracea]|uniref:Agamous-like MADS-box protein AGL12 isoform X2 n=1 Tax=Spinacia oleracea TaxID=3562 RepID=A0A9R0I4F4_SPIOL|nr:agamous-like MADS-box protein AGL12 isoform X2 [Spinacia oleracea]
MARGKVQLKRIVNPVHRQVTFCKRRAGLLKKAKELSVLCDADVGVVVFSPQGKLYELSTKGTMQGLIERYMKCTSGFLPAESETDVHKRLLESKDEVNMMTQEIKLLEKGLWSIFGGAEGAMTLDELHALEKHLESWIYQIRATKMKIMSQEIQVLKNKEGVLRAANKYLQQKVEEQCGFFNVEPLTTNIPYALTIPNEIYEY